LPGGYDTPRRRNASLSEGEKTMRKLVTVLLGLSLAIGSVGVTFAQDQPKKEDESKKKKGKKKKDEEPKKETR
jgi:uncharacterized protein HemX